MNIERINALADLIEQQEHNPMYMSHAGFGMNQIAHEGNTPSCIAGWAAWEAQGRPEKLPNISWALEEEAAKFLDILPENRKEFRSDNFPLFYPSVPREDYNVITPQHAARVLRHLAATGTVDWNV